MPISAPPNPYKHRRFPAEIISHGVWWCFRFCLGYRDVEELRFARGVIVTDTEVGAIGFVVAAGPCSSP
jgi:transposase-like protein